MAQSCTLQGDCNCDDVVDIFDLVIVGNSFAQAPGNANYDPRADANQSGGAIDIFDLIAVGSNFGATTLTYTITATAGQGGSITPEGEVTVVEGGEQIFTITPDAGYTIQDVLVDGSSVGAEATYTFTNVTSDHTIEAQFIDAQDRVPGVHIPIPIDPTVEITDAQFVMHLYQIILDRDYDVPGFEDHFDVLQETGDREGTFQNFLSTTEFLENPSLHTKDGYIRRLYRVLFKREATEGEVDDWLPLLKEFDGSGSGTLTWFEFYNWIMDIPDFKAANCHDSYYTYGRPLNPDTPLLRDLFEGDAYFEDVADAQDLSVTFNPDSNVIDVGVGKLPIIFDEESGKYYSFARGYLGAHLTLPWFFNIFLLESTDGMSFHEVGSLFNASRSFDGPLRVFLEPHFTIDYSVCPKQFILTMTCQLPETEYMSLCASYSSTPFIPESWTEPKLLVKGCDYDENNGCDSNRGLTADIGVALIEGQDKYLSWSTIDHGEIHPWDPITGIQVPDEGDEFASSKGLQINDFDTYLGYVNEYPNYLLEAERDTHCTSTWDCNNKDQQDWEKEGDYYYAIYNGANYHYCFRHPDDYASNWWQLSVARSTNPLGPYNEFLDSSKRLKAERKDLCGISYPVVNEIGGELYLYYDYSPFGEPQGSALKRSKLVYAACGNLKCEPGETQDSCPEDCELNPDQNFISHWNFDEGSETTAHDSIGNNNGRIKGASWITGVKGSALEFDGVDDIVYVPDSDSLDLTNHLTFSAWIKSGPSHPGDWGTILTKNNLGSEYSYYWAIGYGALCIDLSGLGEWVCSSTNITSDYSGVWTHIATVHDGSHILHYINGVLDNSTPVNIDTINSNYQPLTIGQRLDTLDLTWMFNGAIDEVKIYNKALSSDEVRELYNGLFL